MRGQRGLAGGDISNAYLLTLEDGRQVFLKSHSAPPRNFFRAEASGLDWLRETKTLRIPEVLAVSDDFLALEYLESAPKSPGFDEALGHGLAALHRHAPGQVDDNFIGILPQSNTPAGNWVDFYVERRLQVQLRKAIDSGKGPAEWGVRFERLYRALPNFIPEEPLSRLHGDLWGGNLLIGPQGEPCLIDPAVYSGHREVDLAMMRLFGGFADEVFEAYGEAFPLKPGHEERVPLYQLYPLLVHVNLFGSSYVGSVNRALKGLP